MQTILGSGGSIGIELAKALPEFTDKIRLVSRNPRKVNDTDELFTADLTMAERVEEAVQGSEVVYLVAGIQYSLKQWQEQWPKIMKNVIDACKTHKAKLVFFDNIYMYDPNRLADMTENTRFAPCSKKGKVREQIARMLLDAMEKGSITAQIARAADFIGPKNSVIVEVGYNNLLKGKKGMWFIDGEKVHNFTPTAQAGKAVALLGNTEDAYHQSWHLPSTKERITGKEWMNLFAEEMGIKPKIMVVPKWMLQLMGLFNPLVKETIEMLYQYDRDYYFDSSKFEKRFKTKPITAREAVREIIGTA